MARPPKTKRKLGAVARAEIGAERTCPECDETKVVSEQTFTPYSKGFRGWKEVCKVCEATARSGSHAAKKAVNLRRGASREDLDELIDEMYLQNMSPKADLDVLDHCVRVLGTYVRELYVQGEKQKSFETFIEIVKPLIANWVEPGIIHDDIKAGLLSESQTRLIIATRYSAKSTLTGIYVAWRIFLDPLIKVMVISRGAKLAARMLRTVRHVFIAQCPMLRDLVPTEDCIDNAEQFMVPATLRLTTGGATLTSLGISSNLPGYRSDLTIGDDIEGPQEDTPEKVMALNEALTEIHMINPKGEKIMLGTYQSEYSIYAVLGDQEDENGDKVWDTYRACMFEEDVIDGKVTYHSRWSQMFSDEDAWRWRQRVTERSWRLHAMLIADPSILNERPLKIRDFILADWMPTHNRFPVTCTPGGEEDTMTTWGAPKGDVWVRAREFSNEDTAPYAQSVLAVDPASGLAGRDAIGVACLGITATGLGVVRHLEGVRGPDKLGNIARVASLAKLFDVDAVLVEELADGLFGETLENQLMMVEFPMQVTKVTTGGQQKGRRIIESLAPPMGNGRLVMLRRVAQSDHGGDFVNQLVSVSWDGRTGKAKDHDDIVDALAHAVMFCKGSLVSDMGVNRGELQAAKLDDWRGLPMRYGGLGADSEEHPQSRSIHLHSDGEGDNLAERLLEDDRVLATLEARKEDLMQQLAMRVRAGVDEHIVATLRKRIIQTNHQIQELRSLNVL